jgi:hypothetical protein
MRRSNALSPCSVVQMITTLHRYLVGTAQQSVHPTCGSPRDLQAFFWLWAFSTSQSESTPAHTRVTQAVGRFIMNDLKFLTHRIIVNKKGVGMLKKLGLLTVVFFLAACSGKPSQPATTTASPTPVQATSLPPRPTATQPSLRVNYTTSGIISQDETWRGEIHITGDIQIANGATLSIEPGTMVYLASNSDDQHMGMDCIDDYIREHNDPVGSAEWDQNAILIDGRNGIINAVGTAEQPITFRPEGDSTSPGQWYGKALCNTASFCMAGAQPCRLFPTPMGS